MQETIPRVFVKFAAGGSEREAEALWDRPLDRPDLPQEMQGWTPRQIWNVEGSLVRAKWQQTLIQVLSARRMHHSPMFEDLRITELPGSIAGESFRARDFVPHNGNGHGQSPANAKPYRPRGPYRSRS